MQLSTQRRDQRSKLVDLALQLALNLAVHCRSCRGGRFLTTRRRIAVARSMRLPPPPPNTGAVSQPTAHDAAGTLHGLYPYRTVPCMLACAATSCWVTAGKWWIACPRAHRGCLGIKNEPAAR